MPASIAGRTCPDTCQHQVCKGVRCGQLPNPQSIYQDSQFTLSAGNRVRHPNLVILEKSLGPLPSLYCVEHSHPKFRLKRRGEVGIDASNVEAVCTFNTCAENVSEEVLFVILCTLTHAPRMWGRKFLLNSLSQSLMTWVNQ
jgi:hypothetical protein